MLFHGPGLPFGPAARPLAEPVPGANTAFGRISRARQCRWSRHLVRVSIERRERERAMVMKSQLFGGKTRVTFSLPAADLPGPVSVVGDFNGWQPGQHELKPRR